MSQCHLPASLTDISCGIFAECSALTAIDVDVNNPAYRSLDGVLFTKAGTTLVEYPAGRAGVYSIPQNVTTIGAGAFWGCTNLLIARFLGDAPTAFGTNVFKDCATDFKITYRLGKTGFTSPVWNGYPCEQIYSSLQMKVSPAGSGSTTPVSGTTLEYTSSPMVVAIAAAPAGGYFFADWSVTGAGAVIADENSPATNVTLTAAAEHCDAVVTANFIPVYTVTFKTDGTAGASLTGNTHRTVARGGNTTPVRAVAPKGSHLSGWKASNGAIYRNNPLRVNTVTTNLTLTADFRRDANTAVLLWYLLSGQE